MPGVIVQGARDLVTPPAAALDLHREWLGSVLRFVEGTGHDTHQAALARQLVAATDSFAAATHPHRRRASDSTHRVDEAPCAPRWRHGC